MIDFDGVSPILCTQCQGDLEPHHGRNGFVFVCRRCRAGATTLPVLKRVAPRAFTAAIWRAAWEHGVLAPDSPCPSCTQPLVDLPLDRVQVSHPMRLCLRCMLVWLEEEALRGLSLVREAGARLPPRPVGEPPAVLEIAAWAGELPDLADAVAEAIEALGPESEETGA